MQRRLILLVIVFSGLCLQKAKCANVLDYLNSSTLTATGEPDAPTGPTTATGCGSASVTVTSTPPTGITYYWQTTANGRLTTTPFTSPKSVTAAGTYYINANDPSIVNGWSSDLAVVVTIKALPVFTVTANPATICVNPLTTTTLTASGELAKYEWDNGLGTGGGTDDSKTASFTATTTVHVVGTNSEGCTGKASAIVTVDKPADPIIVNSATGLAPIMMCKGTDQALEVNNQSTYSIKWIVGKTTPSTQNKYTISKIAGDIPLKVVYTNPTTNCRSDTTKLTIQMDPVKAKFSTLNTSIKVGGAVYFTDNSTNAAQWYWTFGIGEHSSLQNPVFYYNSKGKKDVQLVVISSNNCKDTSTLLEYINVSITGVQKLKDANIIAYPNPFKDAINVDLTGENKDIEINIYNLMGTKIKTSQIKYADGIEKLDVSELPRGIYMLVLTIDRTDYSVKITKE